jgi:nucleoside-diphosphate-sugar epimerase
MSASEAIVVTGASGFIGGAVVREIVGQGRRAVGVFRHHPPVDLPANALITDLASSSEQLEQRLRASRAKMLIHCALPARDVFDTDPDAADLLCGQIDRNVIRACLESEDLQHVVLVSSSAVYGSLDESQADFGENSDPNPLNQYGRTKLAQEARWATLSDRLTVARVFNVTGPGEPTSMVVRSLAHRIAAAPPQSVLSLRNSQSVRDVSDIRDVAGALLHIGQLSARFTRLVNVCSGVGTTVLHLANLMVAASGSKVTIEPDGLGAENRSVGDPTLLNSTGWLSRFRLDESVRAVWNFSARAGDAETSPSFP